MFSLMTWVESAVPVFEVFVAVLVVVGHNYPLFLSSKFLVPSSEFFNCKV